MVRLFLFVFYKNKNILEAPQKKNLGVTLDQVQILEVRIV